MKRSLKKITELLYILVQKELKVRYKSSFFGYLWALANPFAFAFVYYFAFKMVMRVQMPNYSVFLLTGMFPWLWFTNSLVHATGCYRNNASLVKRVNLPRSVLPMSSIAYEMIHFCLTLPVLATFILATGGNVHVSWMWQVPLMILLQAVILYPYALILALGNVFVHDIEHLVGIGLSLLFFLTPIVYPISLVPESFSAYLSINPLASLISTWRGILLNGQLNTALFLHCMIFGAIGISLARWMFVRMAPKLGELL